jgi:hypothetical protein
MSHQRGTGQSHRPSSPRRGRAASTSAPSPTNIATALTTNKSPSTTLHLLSSDRSAAFPVPRPVIRPDFKRCRTVATTSPSSAGPTTSWMVLIRPAKVRGRCEALASLCLPLLTLVTALRSIKVAMWCPPVVPRHRCTRSGSRPCALVWCPEYVCGTVRLPGAVTGPSGCVVLTLRKIGCMRWQLLKKG